ncbi:MAG: multidrug transporter, partial [Clostridia bacterium]|nr:multidrug transporter [Clostridia bacterium]
MKTGLIVTLGVYIVLSTVLIACVKPLLKVMATDTSILEMSATYIRIEAVANIFGILGQFALVGLIAMGKDKFVYLLTGARLVLCVFLDLFLVSTLPFSANLGVNGIGISNIIVNAVLFGIMLLLLAKNGVNVFNKEKLDFKWMKEFVKI